MLATQNPIEQEGTYPLPEAQLDRFMFNIWVDYPSAEEEEIIVEATTKSSRAKAQPILTKEEVLQLQEVVRKIPVSKHVDQIRHIAGPLHAPIRSGSARFRQGIHLHRRRSARQSGDDHGGQGASRHGGAHSCELQRHQESGASCLAASHSHQFRGRFRKALHRCISWSVCSRPFRNRSDKDYPSAPVAAHAPIPVKAGKKR